MRHKNRYSLQFFLLKWQGLPHPIFFRGHPVEESHHDLQTMLLFLGNHGEDVKECYYYLDSTPTHSYMKGLYKYPQSEYPYSLLESENRQRGLYKSEYELADTGNHF